MTAFEIETPQSIVSKENLAWQKVEEIRELCKTDGHVIFIYRGNPIHGGCQWRGWTNPENGDDESRIARKDSQGNPIEHKWYGFKMDESEIKIPIKSLEALYMMIGNPLCRESPYNNGGNHQYYVGNPSLYKKEDLKKMKSSHEGIEAYNKLVAENDPEGLYMVATLLGSFENDPTYITHALMSAAMNRPSEFIKHANDAKRVLKSTLLQLKQRGIIVDERFALKYRPIAGEDGIFLGRDFDTAVELVSGDANLFESMSAKLKSLKEDSQPKVKKK